MDPTLPLGAMRPAPFMAMTEPVWRQACELTHMAQVEAVCTEHRPFCSLTEAAERAALQRFMYLDGAAGDDRA